MVVVAVAFQSAPPPDYWQGMQWRVAVIVGIISAALAVASAIGTYFQRRKEHRWKQAELGKRILDELFADPLSRDACYMLDVGRRQYPDLAGRDATVSRDEVLAALCLAKERAQGIPDALSRDLTPKQLYICDCFDVLFYRLNRLEHFIQRDLVRFDDVITPLEYYAERIRLNRREFVTHMETFQHERAEKLLRRYWDPSHVGRLRQVLGAAAARVAERLQGEVTRPQHRRVGATDA